MRTSAPSTAGQVAPWGNPQVMKLATQRGLTHPYLMTFVFKLLANQADPQGGDAMDRFINGLAKVALRA